MYARGILWGKMKYELGDQSIVRCPELDLVAEIEFKVRGWVSGTYNAIGGVIKVESTGDVLYELSGLWSDEMTITNVKVRSFFTHVVLTGQSGGGTDWTTLDRPARDVLRRPEIEAHETDRSATGRPGRARVTAPVAEGRPGGQGPRPRPRDRREVVHRGEAAPGGGEAGGGGAGVDAKAVPKS